jgi:hypothetical protein
MACECWCPISWTEDPTEDGECWWHTMAGIPMQGPIPMPNASLTFPIAPELTMFCAETIGIPVDDMTVPAALFSFELPAPPNLSAPFPLQVFLNSGAGGLDPVDLIDVPAPWAGPPQADSILNVVLQDPGGGPQATGGAINQSSLTPVQVEIQQLQLTGSNPTVVSFAVPGDAVGPGDIPLFPQGMPINAGGSIPVQFQYGPINGFYNPIPTQLTDAGLTGADNVGLQCGEVIPPQAPDDFFVMPGVRDVTPP